MATVQGVKLKKGGTVVFPITHINAVKNENGQNLSEVLNGKANSSHSHDDKYYPKSDIDSKVSTLNSAVNGKANSSHSHYVINNSVSEDWYTTDWDEETMKITLPKCEVGKIQITSFTRGGYEQEYDGEVYFANDGGTYIVLDSDKTSGSYGSLIAGGNCCSYFDVSQENITFTIIYSRVL